MSFSDDEVFLYSTDADRFQCLSLADKHWIEYVHSGELHQYWGESQTVELYGAKRKTLSDLPDLDFRLPVFSANALKVLRPLLAKSIEVLKLVGTKGDYWAIGVPWTFEAIDIDKSKCRKRPDGYVNDVKQGVFHRDKIEGEMFCIGKCHGVYVTGRFLNTLHESKLTGFSPNQRKIGHIT